LNLDLCEPIERSGWRKRASEELARVCSSSLPGTHPRGLPDFPPGLTQFLVIIGNLAMKFFLKFLLENFDKGNRWLTRLVKKLN
jgi:hypothetical protein